MSLLMGSLSMKAGGGKFPPPFVTSPSSGVVVQVAEDRVSDLSGRGTVVLHPEDRVQGLEQELVIGRGAAVLRPEDAVQALAGVDVQPVGHGDLRADHPEHRHHVLADIARGGRAVEVEAHGHADEVDGLDDGDAVFARETVLHSDISLWEVWAASTALWMSAVYPKPSTMSTHRMRLLVNCG